MSTLDTAHIRALLVDPALRLDRWTLHDLDQYDWLVDVDDKVRVAKAGEFEGLVEYRKTDPPEGELHDDANYEGRALRAFFAVRVEGADGLVGHFLNEDGQWSLETLVPDLRLMAEAEHRRLEWLNKRRHREPSGEVEEIEFDCCIQAWGSEDDVSFEVVGFPIGTVVGFPGRCVQVFGHGSTRGVPAGVQKALDRAIAAAGCEAEMTTPYQRDPQPLETP